MLSPDKEERVKKEFSHLKSTYFNTAYLGPSPQSAKKKVSEALERELNPSFYGHEEWLSIPERVRVQMGHLLGVSPDHITHSTSVCDLMSMVGGGYPLVKNDLVCSIQGEYPSNILPWMRLAETRGILFKALDPRGVPVITDEWLKKYLPSETKIFIISLVTFDTGRKIDLVSLGKYLNKKGIFFVVDASQAFGSMPVRPREIELIDVLAFASYKWLLGPYGHAFGYFSQLGLDKIEHGGGNWIVSASFKGIGNLLDYTTETLSGARKYDRGQTPNMLAMSCLEAALSFLNEQGLDNIEKHNSSIRDYFLDNYPRKKYTLVTPPSHMGHIVCLRASSSSETLEGELKKRNIDVSVREGNIRLSFHIFNTTQDVDTLIEAL